MTVELRPMGAACQLQCTYCLPADAPVLIAQGTWIPISQIKINDTLIGFDENPIQQNKVRQYKKTTVTAVSQQIKAGFKICTDYGDFTASDEHKWLDKDGKWRETSELRVGQGIKWITTPIIQLKDDQVEMLINTNVGEEFGTILSILPVEEQIMYDITTTTSTFVAYGFATHNCYQNSMREAGNTSPYGKYDVDVMLATVDEVGQPFNLFGGEALLIPKPDLERFWKHSFEKYGGSTIQSNGALIDDDHIALFKKYHVGVGISIDGPGELNDLRVSGSLEETRATTAKIITNIEKLSNEGVGAGVIITMHTLNGTPEILPKLMDFIDWLYSIGISAGNIHTLEVDSDLVAKKYCLSEAENAEAFVTLAAFFQARPKLNWKPFSDVTPLLKGDDRHSLCFWRHCDPHNTSAVYGIEADGSLSNCTRTNKEGIEWLKADDSGYERYISLYNSPDEFGGCKDCRFWLVCGGSCPGESGNRDFRNKTIHCTTMKSLLGFYEDKLEAEGITPISKYNHRRDIEQVVLKGMEEGRLINLWDAKNTISERNRLNREASLEQRRAEQMKISRVPVIGVED